MPNYCYNCIRVVGTKRTIKNFVKKHIVEGEFDFRTIIPEPKTPTRLNEKYIINEDSRVRGVEGKEWFNWYEWNRDYWGTKWNAWDTQCASLEDIEADDLDSIFINFTTAWCGISYDLFEKLCVMHPNLEFLYGWAEPMMCNYGAFVLGGTYYGLSNCKSELEELGLNQEYDYCEEED